MAIFNPFYSRANDVIFFESKWDKKSRPGNPVAESGELSRSPRDVYTYECERERECDREYEREGRERQSERVREREREGETVALLVCTLVVHTSRFWIACWLERGNVPSITIAQGRLSRRTSSPRTRGPVRVPYPGMANQGKWLHVINRGAVYACTLTFATDGKGLPSALTTVRSLLL